MAHCAVANFSMGRKENLPPDLLEVAGYVPEAIQNLANRPRGAARADAAAEDAATSRPHASNRVAADDATTSRPHDANRVMADDATSSRPHDANRVAAASCQDVSSFTEKKLLISFYV